MAQQGTDGVDTVVSIVYVTASPTFTGPTAGFVTLTQGSAPTDTEEGSQPTVTEAVSQPTATGKRKTANNSATSAAAQTTMQAAQTTAAPASTPTQSSITSGSTLQADSSKSHSSMGTPVIAGIAIGAFVILGLIAAGALLFIRKKKRQQKEQDRHNQDREKSNTGFVPLTGSAPSRAPRLSLRPGSQFLPLMAVPNPKTTQDDRWENRPHSPEKANPFGSSAEKAAANAPLPVPPPAAARPVDNTMNSARNPPAPVSDLPYSSTMGAAPVTARSPPGARSPPAGNVHRVQLDFKPSMDDELELQAGQLVRVLHEYDDGWALCVYMDRSKQGVAPRTCLSQHALKPRPAGPPPRMAPLQPQQQMRNFSGPPSSGARDPLYPAPLSPSMPNMRTSPPQGGRQRSYSQSQSPGMNPAPRTGRVNGPSGMNDHRRSASMGQFNNGSPGRKPLPGGRY